MVSVGLVYEVIAGGSRPPGTVEDRHCAHCDKPIKGTPWRPSFGVTEDRNNDTSQGYTKLWTEWRLPSGV